MRLPTLLLDNKSDRLGDPEDDLEVFRELTGLHYPALAVSAATGHGLGSWGRFCSAILHRARLHQKRPVIPQTASTPSPCAEGRLEDVARLVPKDVVRTLRYARVWGKSGFEGQQVGRGHPVEDGDIVELHT